MRYQHVDDMWAAWQRRMAPKDPQMAAAQHDDALHHTMLEMMRRFAHMYDAAMRLEDVPDSTRDRVLSMVLLGSPDGLESLAYKRAERLYQEAILSAPPTPIYFSPYSFPFHPDEPGLWPRKEK